MCTNGSLYPYPISIYNILFWNKTMDNNWHTISIMSIIFFPFSVAGGQFLPFLMCLEQMSSFLTRICVRIYFASTTSLDFFQKVWNFWMGIDNVDQERNIDIKTGDLCLIVAWSPSYESRRIISCTVHWIQLNCWRISGLACVPCERSGRKILFQHNKDMFTKKTLVHHNNKDMFSKIPFF